MFMAQQAPAGTPRSPRRIEKLTQRKEEGRFPSTGPGQSEGGVLAYGFPGLHLKNCLPCVKRRSARNSTASPETKHLPELLTSSSSVGASPSPTRSPTAFT